jgi:fatty-acyl-CoA synthase
VTELPLTTSYWPADTTSAILETTVGGVLRAAARWAPDQVALVDGSPDLARRREWRFGELLADAERIASALSAHFAPGDRIAVWAANCPEWVLLEFAAGLAGLVLVPVNPAYQETELAYVLRHSRARGIFMAAEHVGHTSPRRILSAVRDQLPELREVFALADLGRPGPAWGGRQLPDVDPDSPAQVLYTSGTTGRPKAALLTHRGLTNNARLAIEATGLRAGETAINPMPLSHVAGGALMTLGFAQALVTHVVAPYFSPALAFELIESYRSALIGGVPTMLSALIDQAGATQHDLSSLRLGIGGGAPFPAGLVRQAEAVFGVPFLITFGQAESSCSITFGRLGDTAAERTETLGRPLPQTEVKIVEPRTGELAPCGTTGEICTRGYLVMQGYLGDEAATSAAIDSDGWLHTGDLGVMDDRGYCRIQGRVRELIIRGGENIHPREIEDVLLSHPGVTEAAVVGVPDLLWGEVVGAAIRPAATAEWPTEAELTELCRSRLAGYKAPSRWLFTSTFPLTAAGRVSKDQLSAQLSGQLSAAIRDSGKSSRGGSGLPGTQVRRVRSGSDAPAAMPPARRRSCPADGRPRSWRA